MIYLIYNTLLTLLLILAAPVALPAVFLTRRIREGFRERVGLYPPGVRAALQGGRPVWIHAVSVGEVRVASTLVSEIRKRFPTRKILLSVFTCAGYRMACQIRPAADGVIFFPVDHPWAVRRALKLFDPAVMVFLESEIWPNFLYLAHRRGIPTVLISGRISERAFRRYCSLSWFFSKVLRQFTMFGMQSEDYARRVADLGVDPVKVMVTGNLKHADWGNLQAGNGAEGALEIKGAVTRRILVAGSTHRGEEEVLLDVFSKLKVRIPDLLMILAPRHPQRFDEVEKLLQRGNVRYLRKSEMNGNGAEDTDIIFLDSLGDLPSVYRFAHVVFVGGSLVDAGGHNLIEPARWSKPVLFGPYMTNFADLADEMKNQGGGVEVRGEEDLTREILSLLEEPEKALRVGAKAKQLMDGDRGVVNRSMGLLGRYL